MFSGIVKGVGRILERADAGGDQRLTIGVKSVALPEFHPGNSVAVNGVCLTVVVCDSECFTSDVSVETLSMTTLGDLTEGDSVNLENALRLGDSLDGHLLTGHVDGVGRVKSVEEAARSIMLRIQVDEVLVPYIARKGSVAVDGVSLTVNAVENTTFQVNVVPHTREMTVIAGYRPGTAVNIEVDIVARYLERLVQCRDGSAGINLE